MVERIYIDGQLFELGESGGIELVYQSPLFTDLDSIVSNRTNEVRFPLTRNNRKAMRLAGFVSPESSGLYEYRIHSVSYWRDGVHLFDGSATLLSWSASEVSFVFTWGNSEAFKRLFDTPLSALQDDASIAERYIPFGVVGRPYDIYHPINLSYGLGALVVPYTHPSLQVEVVIAAIERYCGVSGLSGNFNGLMVPLLTKNTDRAANIIQAPSITEGSTREVYYLLEYKYFYLALGESDTDYISMATNGWVFDVSQYNSVTLQINDYAARLTTVSSDISASYSGNIVVFATDAEGNNGIQIAEIPTTAHSFTDGTSYGQIFRVSGIEEEINVSGYTHIIIRLAASTTNIGVTDALTFDTIDVHIVPDIDEPQEVLYLEDYTVENYPLYTNLPDMSMGEFVKNLMKIKGLFAQVKSSTEISFVSLADMYDRRTGANNYSKRVIGSIKEIRPTFGEYAQRNKLQYAEDSTTKGNYDSVLVVDNTTLEAERELLRLEFGGTDTDANNILTIPIYTYGGESGDVVEYDGGLSPRVLIVDYEATGNIVSFKGLSFTNLVSTVYADYQRTILHPRVLTVDLYINAMELATLDLTKPIYIEQFGHYYAIISLTTKGANRATATLLQLADE